jgi:predicted dinucleotide-binding enzyme
VAQTRIAVLGTGNIGGNLGRKWIAAGHVVTFGVNDPNSEKSQALKADLGDKADIRTTSEAIPQADVVVFAIPGRVMDDTIKAHAAALDGKLVIDIANNMGGSAPNSHAAFQQHTPRARYARTFNMLGWENFVDASFKDGPADLFYVAPEADSATIEGLIADVGYHPVRLGDGDQVDLTDALLRIWFTLSRTHGRRLAFKMLTS